MRDGLALRWIGLHAAAFATALACEEALVWGAYALFPRLPTSVGDWMRGLVFGALAGVLLGVAQTLAARGWPASRLRWCAATSLGEVAGRMAYAGLMAALIQVMLARRDGDHLLYFYVFAVMHSFTMAILLALSQAMALIGLLPRKRTVHWFACVVAASFAMDILSSLLWHGIEFAMPVASMPKPSYFLFSVLMALVRGALFGAVLLPMSRRIRGEVATSAV